ADDWNIADYEMIRRIGREILQGRPVESWVPNAGSLLVVEVMNNLKVRYPFVDLLKPEVEAVLPTLLALAPKETVRLKEIASVAGRLGWTKVKRATGFLDFEGEIVPEPLESRVSPVTSQSRGRAPLWDNSFRLGSQNQTEAMLQAVEQRF